MKDYTKLVEALRNHASKESDCRSCKYYYYNIVKYDTCSSSLCAAAASAIEELQQIADHHEQSAKDYWKEACEYKAQMPKRGEWIKHPEVKNIYGGVYIECPLCGEKYVVQNVSDEKFCRNCGADLRAKMEVQE